LSGVQETSLEVYFDKVLPKLAECQQKVLDIFYENPGRDWTNMELAEYLGWSVNRVTPRTYELRKKGFLRLSQKRMCGITRNRAMAWRAVE